MCRWIAYRGDPVFLSDLVTDAEHALVHQALHAREAKTGTNGDGFGLGWYGERDEPGIYREVLPAWSDENLRHLAHQIRSRLFFAHVRASTGTATTRANCHPFAVGRWMFMHNGQIGGWPVIKRRVESLLPDALYTHRAGTTDSEALFLLMLAEGLAEDPVGATARALATCARIAAEAGVCAVTEPIRLTAALSDGARLVAIRWASDGRPPTLYWRRTAAGIVVVSEPTDSASGCWEPVGDAQALVCCPAGICRPEPFRVAAATLAA